MKKWGRRLLGTGILCVLLILFCNFWITRKASGKVFDSIAELPVQKTALVLGTIPELKNGEPNLYFQYRMEKAYELYQSGKVRHFILSGDNHKEGYDEPEAMRQALRQMGIPDSCLHLDYAGFRTLDSVVRLKEIFGQDSAIVISQEFHNKRAIFLGEAHGISLYGLNAKNVGKNNGFKTQLREYLARVKACLDIYILHTQPKFLGKPISID